MHSRHVFIQDAVYKRDAQFLDLRGTGITVEHYEALRQQLPDCEVRWDIPFQNGYLADDAQEICVTSLSEADIQRLDYLTGLKSVDGTNCTAYGMLQMLQNHRPEVKVHYQVTTRTTAAVTAGSTAAGKTTSKPSASAGTTAGTSVGTSAETSAFSDTTAGTSASSETSVSSGTSASVESTTIEDTGTTGETE